MLNVTFLTGEYPPMQGGIADYTAHLLSHLTSLQINPAVLTSHRWHSPQPPAITVHAATPNWGGRSWLYVAHHLKRYRPDILHIQYQAAMYDLSGWVNWLPCYLRLRRWPIRIVTTFHDLRVPYIFPKAGQFRWQSMLALARYSHAVICTDHENLVRLKQAGLNDSVILQTIPLGSNIDPYPPADFDRAAWRARYQADNDTLLLTYFGFLNESKGGEELLESVALLRQRGRAVRLVLIGGEVGDADPTNAAFAQRMRALIKQYDLTEQVYFTGYVTPSDVSAHLLAADAMVMPYREGITFRRTTLVTALRHGCPLISTEPLDPRLIPEVRDGENVLLARRHDALSLAETLSRFADNSILRYKLAAGAKQLGQRFEWSHLAQATANLYDEVMKITH
jgi:glycosyltransferase involved in cell wall biosynthesis